MKRWLPLVLCCAAFSDEALSSTSEAWAEHDTRVREACIAASTLSKPRVTGKIVLFNDDVGYSAVMLEGHYPQAHMNGWVGRELCLYDRQARKAHVAEADDMLDKLAQ